MRAGWSREALAYHSGVSWSAIAQIESGRRKDVRLSSLSALAGALGVSVDYLIGNTATSTPQLFEHRLLTYGSDEDYLEAAIPYIVEGVEQSQSVLVVATQAQIALLRDTLDGDRAEHVEFADSIDWYTTLTGAVSRYGAYLKQKLEAGAAWIRILGDPVWAGRTEAEVTAWFRYESLVNLVFASSPATIVCPYDTRSFPEQVVAEAHRTHPVLTHGRVDGESLTYQLPEEFLLERGVPDSTAVDHNT